MPAGITSSDSMFSVRETPWHGLGAVLERPPATIAEAIEASGLGWRVEREPIAVDRGDAATVDDWWEPRCEEIPGYYATVRQDTRHGARDRRRALPDRAERGGVSVRRPAARLQPALRDRRQPARRPAGVGARDAARARRGRRRPGPSVRAVDEQPRRVDRGDRRDDAGQGGVPEHAELGACSARGRGSRSATPSRSAAACTRPVACSSSRSTTTSSSRPPATSSRQSACTERQLRRVLDELYPSGTEDRVTERTQRSREQTKQRIVELFLHGDTQGNAPGEQVGGGQRDRRVRRLASPDP